MKISKICLLSFFIGVAQAAPAIGQEKTIFTIEYGQDFGLMFANLIEKGDAADTIVKASRDMFNGLIQAQRSQLEDFCDSGSAREAIDKMLATWKAFEVESIFASDLEAFLKRLKKLFDEEPRPKALREAFGFFLQAADKEGDNLNKLFGVMREYFIGNQFSLITQLKIMRAMGENQLKELICSKKLFIDLEKQIPMFVARIREVVSTPSFLEQANIFAAKIRESEQERLRLRDLEKIMKIFKETGKLPPGTKTLEHKLTPEESAWYRQRGLIS